MLEKGGCFYGGMDAGIGKAEIYTPCAALEGLLEALAQVGAGVVGKYTYVCSYAQVEGT